MNYQEIDKRFCPPMAWAEIDLKAVTYNVKAIKKFAGKNVMLLAVVKAQCYGHGLTEIVKVLERQGIEFFCVSDINEAIMIRKLKIKKPILMLESALPDYARYLVDYNITPVVCTLELARALNRFGQKRRKKIPVHIKIDTGMGRLGVWQDEAFDFIKMIKRFAWLKIEGLCTHFPVADTDVPFTNKQIKTILHLVEKIRDEVTPVPFVHAANSLGLSAYQHSGFNLARTGLMLYGLYPSPSVMSKIKLKPVMSVKARICFVKHVFLGRKISYGHTFTASKNMRVATVSIGYSDGYLRAFSNKSFV
ncbi:MAG: alanine racemase, partial [Candidatus Omnitrophica bacterium]|nr:alanine racemase [Candidatus Omnitrophota bacterium]